MESIRTSTSGPSFELFDKIALTAHQSVHFVKKCEIYYIKGQGNYCQVFLQNREPIFVTKPLKKLEALLEKCYFFRVHQSYLVNLRHVAQISWEDGYFIIMDNDVQVPVARRRKDDLLQMFNL